MKKLFAMILMLSILLAAAGCGKAEQRPTGTTAPGHTTETVAPTHASEATVPTQDTEATTPTQPSEETGPTEPDEPTEPTQEPELVTAYLLEDITMSWAGQTLNMELFYTERWQIEGLCGTFNGDMLLHWRSNMKKMVRPCMLSGTGRRARRSRGRNIPPSWMDG